MQSSRLYRRIYKYITLSVALAVVLTFGVTQLSFYLSNRERKENFAERVIEHQAGIVLFLLQELQKTQPQEVLARRTEQLASDLNWQMRYIPPPVPQALQAQLQGHPLALSKKGEQTLVLGALKPREPAVGVIEFQIPEPRLDRKNNFPFFKGPPGPPGPGGPGGPPPGRRNLRQDHWIPPYLHLPLILTGVLLLLLALFLVPLVRYITRPLRTFSAAFQQVSDGNFSALPHMDPEFQPMVEAFNHMTHEIQTMLKEKQRLIADVSHELRSPLARMRVSMELLSKEGKGKAKYIERAIREIEELDHLINDLLDVSALDLNAEQAPLEQIQLLDWVQTALERHQLWFEQHHIRVKTIFPDSSPFILGRQHLLDRALNNLLSNVVKYAPEYSQLDLFIEPGDAQVILRIRDRGPGVPAAALAKLTEPFYRVDTSRTRKTGGNGLGLAIVQKIMALHQGSVRFALPTDDEGGLMVSLCFPAIEQFRGTGRLGSSPLTD